MQDAANPPSLVELSRRIEEQTGETSDKPPVYLEWYEKYFEPLREREINVLELGVFHGRSMLLWRDYFARGAVVGLDRDEVKVDDDSGRISIYRGNQQDPAALDRLAAERAPGGFDIIIDDASHVGELSRASFKHLFYRHLKPGGIYVIEDWRTGYYPGYYYDAATYQPPEAHRRFSEKLLDKLLRRTRRRISHPYGLVAFVKELVDELGRDMITNPARGASGPMELPHFSHMTVTPGQVFLVKSDEAFERLMGSGVSGGA